MRYGNILKTSVNKNRSAANSSSKEQLRGISINYNKKRVVDNYSSQGEL
jgi:hypothetical protein